MSALLVTGGSGTFGRAFVRRALESGQWARVVAFSRDEVKQAALREEFGHWDAFRGALGDVRDRERLEVALRHVDVVVHAAALKRVDVGAYSPDEMRKTNVTGTENVLHAALRCGVQRVVVISSDKAVNPTNVYGASKQMAETLATQFNAYSVPAGTRVAAVRYGNVLGSRGSVVHVWRAQRDRGVPLTVTHPQMSRFIMTIEDACALVSTALEQMLGGEVYVPVLPSARMIDLAAAVWTEEGAEIGPRDAWWTETGLRPGGEKMAESLLNEEEPARARLVGAGWARGQYYVVAPSHHEWTDGEAWRHGGEAVSPSLVYRSDRNDRWLDAEQLAALMAETEACR